MTRLVLIDGNAVIHRAFHALPKTLTDKKGAPVNAVYGFTSMLLRVIEELKPTHLAVCFDTPEKTFRQIEYKPYQAHRPEVDSDMLPQFAKVREVVDGFKVPYYEKAGYEADDLIGTIASRCSKVRSTKCEVIIVTGDKDILQLVGGRTKVYLIIKGVVNGEMMDETAVVKKLGVAPSQIIDYKGLVGDPSDNYPGVVGIGPKTAIDLLSRYGTLNNIYKNLSKITGSTKEKLEKHKNDALVSQKLAGIVTDVKFKFNLDDTGKWSLAEGQKILEKYNFRSLLKRSENLEKKLEKKTQLSFI